MKRRLSAPLSAPNMKRRQAGQPDRLGSPFPVPVGTLTGLEASNSQWSVYRGELLTQDGRPGVRLSHQDHVKAVFSNGTFGEVLVNRRLEDQARPVLEDWTPAWDSERQAVAEEQPSSWAQIKESCESTDSCDSRELFLELSESFFLSYSLGCLIVSEGQSELSLQQQWSRFSELQPDFPVMYRVYHHFRSLGWVVRSGTTMGADWVLYKGSPAVSHSTYSVRIEMVDSKQGRVINDVVKRLGWADILGSTRVMGSVKKDLLVARVAVREDKGDWGSPHCLGSMSVTSLRLRRWVPGDMRCIDHLMRKMDGEVDCFNVGATVSCRTCLDKDIEGEVLAYDAATKMLIVKSEATSGRPSLNNIHMLNLGFVSKVEVKKDTNSERVPEPLSLNLDRLNMRAKEQIGKKKKLVSALKAGVSPDGQRLFIAINKTIDEVNWDREEIVVMKTVRISPPYSPDCVKGDAAASNHVRKIVEKHLKDRDDATRQGVGAN